MRRALQMAVFLIVFVTVYTAMHYYALGRLVGWFGGSLGVTFITVVTLLILSFPAANLFSTRWTHPIARGFYDLAAIWMGTLMILLFTVALGELIRLFTGDLVAAWIAIVATILLAGYATWNGSRIIVREYTIPARVDEKHKIAVASDVHAGPAHGKKYVQRIVDSIRPYNPDILLFPGDLVDGPGKLPDDVLAPLKAFTVPMFSSFGNHEHYVGEKDVLRVVAGTGIRVLRDEIVQQGELTIIGIDDREARGAVKRQFPAETPKSYTILLYHRPDGLKDAAARGVDLMLSGHTHYGQVFPFTLLVKLRFPHIKGWYHRGKTRLYVSTGAGTWGPPMRLGSRNEVVIINLTPTEKH